MTIRKVDEGIKASRAVILFVRSPELGKVKTRIAFTEGSERALSIYKSLLRHTRYILSELESDVFTFYSDEIDTDDLWSDLVKDKYVQTQGNLGQRITDAFKIVLDTYQKVIIIGSDCAQLRTQHIEEAFSQLENRDLVIGPSLDGGYYLLGCKVLYPSLFENIPWSTEEVLSETILASDQIGLTVSQLETLSDIDYIEDWEKYGIDYLLVYSKEVFISYLNSLSSLNQKDFFEYFLQQLTIINRSIWSDETETDFSKVEALKWSNELAHTVWNIVKDLKAGGEVRESESLIVEIEFYASHSKLFAGNIGGLLNDLQLKLRGWRSVK